MNKYNIEIELFRHIVPETVKQIMKYAEGYDYGGRHLKYEGCIFHRLIKGFMIQGGDFK